MPTTRRTSKRTAVTHDDTIDLSRAEFVYKQLREEIEGGELRAGQRLREAELAERLRVSRTPVREAMRRLRSEGLIEIAQSRETIVINLDMQRVRELYALREALEGTAARFAARHASPAEIATIRQIFDASMTTANKPAEHARMNRRLHHAIHAAAHNRYLTQALDLLSSSLALLPGTTFEAPGRMDAARDEHRAIVEAIEARNAAKAEELARQHIQMAGLTRMRMMFDTY
jgi:DNA-binding GntR family transcriptional regulator